MPPTPLIKLDSAIALENGSRPRPRSIETGRRYRPKTWRRPLAMATTAPAQTRTSHSGRAEAGDTVIYGFPQRSAECRRLSGMSAVTPKTQALTTYACLRQSIWIPVSLTTAAQVATSCRTKAADWSSVCGGRKTSIPVSRSRFTTVSSPMAVTRV